MLRTLVFALLMCFALSVAAQEAPTPTTEAGEGVSEATEHAESDRSPALADAVRAPLARIDELSNVQVDAGAGVVTLTGTVPSTGDRATAETIAQKIDGVLFVDNRLTITKTTGAVDDPGARDAAMREHLERVFAHVDELSKVTVEVNSGVVRLGGSVLMSSAGASAEALARQTDGVAHVINLIEEERDVSERISPALARTQDIVQKFIASLPLLGVGLAIIVVFFLLGGFVTRVPFLFRRLEETPLVMGIVKQVVRLVFGVIGIMLVLELFDLTALVGALLGGAGVAGLALGFAFKDIAENYLASIMLSIRRPFEKDDLVEIGEFEGKVVRLTTRETVLMTLDGNHLRIPNARVFQSVIVNYARNPLRRFVVNVGVGNGENLKQCLLVGTESIKSTSGVTDQPRTWGIVESLGDSAVNLRFFGWVDQSEADFLIVRSEAIRRLKAAFDRAGIDMPEPVHRVFQTNWTPPPSKKIPPDDMDANIADIELAAPSAQVDEQIERDRRVSDEGDLL